MQGSRRTKRSLWRHITTALLGWIGLLGAATVTAAQCAYPALELLEFDYVNGRHACRMAPNTNTRTQDDHSAVIAYEFEGRLYVIDTVLRWLNLDATAEAWISLPPPASSR